MARKPRIAPTAMKTVPSGRELVCIYGAPVIGGTEAGIILNAPESVGNPDGSPPSLALGSVAVMVGTGAVAVSDSPAPVITAVVACDRKGRLPSVEEPVGLAVFAVREGSAVFDDVLEFRASEADLTASERFGRPVF
jgi:hypothetical protein